MLLLMFFFFKVQLNRGSVLSHDMYSVYIRTNTSTLVGCIFIAHIHFGFVFVAVTTFMSAYNDNHTLHVYRNTVLSMWC